MESLQKTKLRGISLIIKKVRKEYVVRVLLVKGGKFLKIKCSIGYFTLIAGGEPCDYQEVESEAKKATRKLLFHPWIEVCGIEFMAILNDRGKRYKSLADMISFL